MTHMFTKTLQRGMVLMALAGIGLVATPGTARADFITFTVNEGAVGAPTPDIPAGPAGFQANKLNGGYTATLSLVAGGACQPGAISCGNWTETAVSTFSAYYLTPNLAPIDGYIGDSETLPGCLGCGYLIVGNLTSGGTYQQFLIGGVVVDFFTFTSQSGTLSLDRDSNGVGETVLLTASGVGTGSSGTITFSGGITGGTGAFNSNFTSSVLSATGQAYWPTLSLLQFTTTINGELDDLNPFPVVTGDVSVQFTEIPQVPEPATLSLLSLGLAAGARHIRRRRAVKV
jgi:hypothetical protein